MPAVSTAGKQNGSPRLKLQPSVENQGRGRGLTARFQRKLLGKCNSPAISGLRFRQQAESFPFKNYERSSVGETRLVRTHGTGKIFAELVLRKKHADRPRDFAHLADSKAISRLAKGCHVWPQVCRLLSPGRNRMGGIYAIPYGIKPGRTLCCMLQEWPSGTPVPERILSPRSAR